MRTESIQVECVTQHATRCSAQVNKMLFCISGTVELRSENVNTKLPNILICTGTERVHQLLDSDEAPGQAQFIWGLQSSVVRVAVQ